MKEQQKQIVVLHDIKQYPIQYSKRTCTDVFCLIIGIIFAFAMMILAISLFNFDHYYKANFPSDSQGQLCGIDQKARKYSYVYFVNPPDISRRVCVSNCPNTEQKALKCIPTQNIGCVFTSKKGFEVINYQTQQVNTRSGYFCYPKDPTLKDQLLQASKLQNRDTFYKSLDVIQLSFYVSIGMSILYLLSVQFFPKQTNYAALVLGCVMILVTLICILVYSTSQMTSKIIQAIILSILVILIASSAYRFFNSWKINGIFLSHATYVVKQRKSILFIIPIFFIALFIFIVMIVLQFTSFWSSGQLVFNPQKELFYQPVGGGPISLSFILAIQILWGFSFLKSAFNFCVSYITVFWYYGYNNVTITQAFKAMLCKHLGSIIGGSFMTNFLFTALDYIFDIFKPNFLRNPDSLYTKCHTKLCKSCNSLTDLIRQDAISYVALSGNPYCNSSRYCQYICDRSIITDYALSTSRSYRISTHFLIGTIMVIFALYVNGHISINAIYIVILVTLSVATLFISLHCDIADAIQIVFLIDQEFTRRNLNNQYQNIDAENIKKQLGSLSLRADLVDQIKQERLLQASKINKLN